MLYLEIIFKIFLTIATIYAIFHIKDLFQSWHKWIIALAKGIKWLWNKIISIFKKK